MDANANDEIHDKRKEKMAEANEQRQYTNVIANTGWG